MIRLSTDASGFTLDATDEEAIAGHLAKWPEDEGHELEIHRDDASVQVRVRQEAEDGQGANRD